jgi:hypothetical protein
MIAQICLGKKCCQQLRRHFVSDSISEYNGGNSSAWSNAMWYQNNGMQSLADQGRELESMRVRDLLTRGVAAAKANSKDEARNFLNAVTRSDDASPEQLVKAWLWLAEISDDPAEKRKCYEEALGNNPSDPQARRGLLLLDGKLDASDMVDPDKILTEPTPESSQPAQARRFVCTNCGGKMAFTPDGTALACTYCGRRQSLLDTTNEGAMLEEQNILSALWTKKGHTSPVATQALKCQGCGASFVLPPHVISENCPYCASAYVTEQTETHDLIPPEGVVPFAISRDQAQNSVFDWYRKQGYKVLSSKALPSGVYLPVWTFDVSGEISWNCLVETREDDWIPKTGAHAVYENDLTVAASHTLGASVSEEINQFPLEHLVHYDAGFIADWPAETYQIPVSDASLVARWRTLDKTRRPIETSILGHYKDLSLNTMHLVVESYKLILVPLWISRYHVENTWHTVIVNGQTGNVRGEKPASGMRKLFSSLFGQ